MSCQQNDAKLGGPREKALQIENGDIQHYAIIRSDHVVHKTITEKSETEEVVPMPFQNQITNRLIENIIRDESCRLPTYTESTTLHLCLIRNFLN
jgi:hypothetical protein